MRARAQAEAVQVLSGCHVDVHHVSRQLDAAGDALQMSEEQRVLPHQAARLPDSRGRHRLPVQLRVLAADGELISSLFCKVTHSTKAYDRRSNATCWRTSHHLLLFSEDPVPAERAVPAVQRPQERVSTERGRGEHEQPVPVPEEVSVPEAPPRRRRHPRQGVHGHDSQDLQWVLHVSDRMGHGGASDGRQ